jgi:hypothetical protein
MAETFLQACFAELLSGSQEHPANDKISAIKITENLRVGTRRLTWAPLTKHSDCRLHGGAEATISKLKTEQLVWRTGQIASNDREQGRFLQSFTPTASYTLSPKTYRPYCFTET